MGQCGCGDFSPDYKIPAPDGCYVLQLYPGCDYCDNPAGVIVYKMDAEDIKTWRLDEVEETEIWDHGRLIPVIHQKELNKQLVKFFKLTAESLADEFISEAFKEAIHDSFE